MNLPRFALQRPGSCLFALLCWLVPAVLGVGALAAYWLKPDDGFALLGLLDLVFGSVALLVGLIVIGFLSAFRSDMTKDRDHSLRRGILVLVLLLSNVPLAWLCDRCGDRLMEMGKKASRLLA